MAHRQTKQREEIYQVIRGVNRHMTADEVYQTIVKTNPKIGIATVYRNLNHLVEQKMIQRVLDKDICYFDGNDEPHYHLRCIQCGKLEDAPMEYNQTLDKSIEKQMGIQVIRHSMTIDCICSECRKSIDKNKN